MKALSFMMHGRFAHFCSPYTNVYRLTQPCPTKTAIMGFIGSVLGIEKDDLRLYSMIQCGVEIHSEYCTISMPYLTRQGFSGSSANKVSSRTSVEVIVNSKYMIYITGENETLIKLQRLMEKHESIFTPCLGLAQFIASTDFKASNIEESEIIEGKDVEVSGAFIRGEHGELDFDKINHKINQLPKDYKLRITEFEGLKGINPPRNFEHAVFTVNLDGGTVPIKNCKNILHISVRNKYVPIF